MKIAVISDIHGNIYALNAQNAGRSLMWTIENTTDNNKEYLRKLPTEMTLKIGERELVFVHGSPRRINEYLKEQSNEAREVMKDFEKDILVCGHTHIPYYKLYKEKVLINSGSVGKPKTGNPLANYVIINLNTDSVNVDIIEVDYDYEKTAQAIIKEGLPVKFAEIIRTGNA